MANYSNLLATIAANIYTNHNNEVTASMVKTAVDQMVASLGDGYQFAGVATPATDPGTPDEQVFYIASEAGTYTDFPDSNADPIEVQDGEVAVLYGSGNAWGKAVTGAATDKALSDIMTVYPEMDAEMAELSDSHYRIDGSGNFVSFANATLYKVDVRGVSRVHASLVDEHSLYNSRHYAFYSTDDESLMGSGTLVGLGGAWTSGTYNDVVEVPAGAVTLVVVRAYTNMPSVSIVEFKTAQSLTNAIIDDRKGEVVTFDPPIGVQLTELSDSKRYIDSSGDFVSFASTTLLRFDVSGIKRIHISFAGSYSLLSREYAFYSTDDESLMGAGTAVGIGPKIESSYDKDVIVPDGAVTLVIVQVYSVVPSVSIVEFNDVLSVAEFAVKVSEQNDYGDITGKMAVNFNAFTNTLSLGTKYDAGNDLLIHFKPCMFNELMTFYEVGLSANTERYPLPNPQREIEKTLNKSTSDNIGPISTNDGTVGGNHSLNDDGVTRTALMDSYEIVIDGEKITSDYSGYAKVAVVRVVNTIFDPTSPVVDDFLTIPAVMESVLYRIERGDISVMVNHKYLEQLYVRYYSGMQSMFYPTYALTPNGPYVDWTDYANVASFDKEDYPDFNAYFLKDANGNQVAWLDTSYGIGDHSLVDADQNILHINGHKTYHWLIDHKAINQGEEINWRGVYSWRKCDSETSDYINYLLRMWKRDYFYIATKQAFTGDVEVDTPENLGTIETGANYMENARGIHLTAAGAEAIILEVE